MGWIKVTPETMPPEGMDVLTTLEHPDGTRITSLTAARYVHGKWEILLNTDTLRFLWVAADDLPVTHWMPYPEPAED